MAERILLEAQRGQEGRDRWARVDGPFHTVETRSWRGIVFCIVGTHGEIMTTNSAINDKLLKEAQRVGGLRTKEETVTRALEEFIERRRQQKVLKALGSFRFREDWNYKHDRQRRS
jgi:Arc/MetJ family transcription regulator